MRNWFIYVLLFVGTVIASTNEMEYFVVPDSLVMEYDKLPNANDTLEAFDSLDRQQGIYYMDRFELDKALRTSLAKFPRFHPILNNFALGNKSLKHRKTVGLTPDDSIVDFVWLDGKNINTIKNFIRKHVATDSYSKVVSRFLHDLQGIVFADSVMMRRYALSLLAASLGVCYEGNGPYDKISSVSWEENEVEDLFRLKYKSKFRESIQSMCFGSVEPSMDVFKKFRENMNKDTVGIYKDCFRYRTLKRRFISNRCSDDRWNFSFDLVDSLYVSLLQKTVEANYQKINSFNDEIPVVWKTDGCGCSQYKDLNGNVYAVYPYWLAKEGGDTLDFSGITRIAYYGISASDKGVLQMPSGTKSLSFFNKDGYSDFVNEAHKHNVKVDWIIKKSQWGELSHDADKMQDFFRNLVKQVDSLVNTRVNSLFQQFVSCLAIDGRDGGFRGDGVSLWFQNYPTDSVNTRIFKDYFDSLQNKLNRENPYAMVNLMMNLLDLGEEKNVSVDSNYVPPQKGIYSYEFFGKLMKSNFNGTQKKYLIVLSDEPVSRSKLVIYRDLNQQLKNDMRREVLHAVVPMLWLDYQQWEQLTDDASFYNDAYYSLGIAPFGLLNDSAHMESRLSDILLENFEKEDGAHKRQSGFAAFFCTHRWAFRLLNSIVYGLVFLLLISYFAICRVNDYFSRRLALLVALVAIPPLFTSLILTNFDPVIMDYVGKVGQWGSFVIIILTVIAITLLQVYRSADFPRRKK